MKRQPLREFIRKSVLEWEICNADLDDPCLMAWLPVEVPDDKPNTIVLECKNGNWAAWWGNQYMNTRQGQSLIEAIADAEAFARKLVRADESQLRLKFDEVTA